VIAVPISIILGVIVALLRNTIFDRVANVVTLTSISSPGILPRLHPDPLSSR
jgi:peptide/nickel transport system permease protein